MKMTIRALAARAWSLLWSRRVVVSLVTLLLLAATWRLTGPIPGAQLWAALAALAAYVGAESWRRHEGPLAESGRMLTLVAGLLATVAGGVCARLEVEVPADLLAGWTAGAAALIVGQAARTHPVDPEDAPARRDVLGER